MQQRGKRLAALLLAALLAPPLTVFSAETSPQGRFEAGVYGQDIGESGARVNEYSRLGSGNTVTGYGLFDLENANADGAANLSIDITGNNDPELKANFDLKRVLRFSFENSAFYHQLDHDRIDYLNAAVPGANLFASNNPGAPVSIDATGNPAAGTSIWSLGTSPNEELNPNNVPAFVGKDANGNWYATNLGTPPATIAGNAVSWQQIGRASVYGEDFAVGQLFEIERKEAKAKADLTLPALPNITFHAGIRTESREGTEQSLGMSKCTSCHVTGSSREVDEETRDFSAGATGRFGLLTVDYSYKSSEFRENADAPTRTYDPALSPSPATTYTAGNAVFDNRLLYDYEDGALVYDQTPDSEKHSQIVKARLDLPRETALTGTYVTSETKSRKNGEAGIWDITDPLLTSNYDSYGFRFVARLTETVRLTLHGRVEETETDDSSLVFYPMGTTAQPNLGSTINPTLPSSIAKEYESIENRDVATLGANMVWRPARKTTVRVGYEHKSDDREDEFYGETKTETFDAALKTVLAKNLTARADYTYQTIDNPYQYRDAAGYIDPATGLPYTNDPTANLIGNGPLYGTAFYDLRETDLSNQPEEVQEGKIASTWSPSPAFSTTVAVRYRDEKNSLENSDWSQQTFSPSLSFWYAPAQKLNLTFVYNYLGQRAESRFCQGWYDG